MEGKIIFDGKTESGLSILVRYPKKDDVNTLCDYMNALSAERTFIRFQGEVFTLEQEEEFLRKRLEEIEQHKAVHLLAFHNKKLVVNVAINLKDFTSSHVGLYGINVVKEHRGKGLGKFMTEKVLNEARAYIPQLSIVTLEVNASNTAAIALYKKYGFVEHGRLPEGFLHHGNYVDHVYMYKKVK